MGEVIDFGRYYKCHCGYDRANCYCFDRRPHAARTLGMLGILSGLAGFWGGVLYLLFRGTQ